MDIDTSGTEYIESSEGEVQSSLQSEHFTNDAPNTRGILNNIIDVSTTWVCEPFVRMLLLSSHISIMSDICIG